MNDTEFLLNLAVISSKFSWFICSQGAIRATSKLKRKDADDHIIEYFDPITAVCAERVGKNFQPASYLRAGQELGLSPIQTGVYQQAIDYPEENKQIHNELCIAIGLKMN